MVKTALALFALVMANSAAFAENPFVGEPETLAQQDKMEILPGEQLGGLTYKHGRPASDIVTTDVYPNGSAYRFDDASPSSR